MAFIPVPNVVQTELVFNWESQIVENVLHFEPAGGIDVTEMAALGAHIVNWFNTSLKNYLCTSISLINVKLTDLSTETAPVVNYATGLPIAGSLASPTLPNNIALVLTKRTALRGRSYRGRIYVPGLSEGDIVANTVGGGKVTALVNSYSLLLAFTAGSESWEMVVVSRQNNNTPREFGVATQVLSLDSDGTVDSQRRRLPRRGQ